MNSLKALVKFLFPSFLVLKLLTWKHLNSGNEELNLIKILVSQNSNAIDIGVYLGVFSSVMSEYAEKVYAFEPHPDHYAFAKRSLPKNVTIYNLGLSEKAEEVTLAVPEKYPSAGKIGGTFDGLEVKTFKVKTNVLDHYNFTDVSFIKIDAEGHEYEIIKGSQQTIQRNRPNLMVEIEQRHQERKITEVFQLIESMHYAGFFIHDGRVVPLKRFNSDFQQLAFIGVKNAYINNFIFIPSEKVSDYPLFYTA